MSKKNKSRRARRAAGRPAAPRHDDPELEKREAALRLYRSALVHEEKERYIPAMQDSKRCLELLPDMPGPLLVYARASNMVGNPHDAIAAYNRLFEVKEFQETEQHYAVLSERAVAKAKAGHQEDAEADTDRMIKLAPERYLAWFQRGSIRMDRGNYHGSLEDLRHAATLREPDDNLHCMTGEALAHQALHQLDVPHPDLSRKENIADARQTFHTAIHHLHTAQDLNPKHPGAQRDLEHYIGHASDFYISPEGEDLPIPD